MAVKNISYQTNFRKPFPCDAFPFCVNETNYFNRVQVQPGEYVCQQLHIHMKEGKISTDIII